MSDFNKPCSTLRHKPYSPWKSVCLFFCPCMRHLLCCLRTCHAPPFQSCTAVRFLSSSGIDPPIVSTNHTEGMVLFKASSILALSQCAATHDSKNWVIVPAIPGVGKEHAPPVMRMRPPQAEEYGVVTIVVDGVGRWQRPRRWLTTAWLPKRRATLVQSLTVPKRHERRPCNLLKVPQSNPSVGRLLWGNWQLLDS